MTGNLLLDLAVSAAVTAALVVLSFLLGAWRSVRVDEGRMRDRLAFDEPDFRPGAFLIGIDGKAAAALDEAGGEGALVFALGDGLATRRFKLGALAAKSENGAVMVTLRDLSKWRVRIAAPNAEAAAVWAGKLGGGPLKSGDGLS